ncbi:hypothetical protein QNN00_21690 [Bacillus velezensis]|nr:hypothetical protein [Bacillus velezensis]
MTSLDESALTGEAMPAEKTAGDSVFTGTVRRKRLLNGSCDENK